MTDDPENIIEPYSPRNPRGDLIVHRAADGTRVVSHGDPTIMVADELLIADGLDPDVFEIDGVLRFDTAGEYRYRPAGAVIDGARRYVRIGGPDDPMHGDYDPHP